MPSVSVGRIFGMMEKDTFDFLVGFDGNLAEGATWECILLFSDSRN
jgi:transketolase N-terminal domain/subunit